MSTKKKVKPVHPYVKQASIDFVCNPFDDNRRNPIYVDKKLGFVCLDRDTFKVIASNLNKRKCADTARLYLAVKHTKLDGKLIDKEVVFRADDGPMKNKWVSGKLTKVSYSGSKHGYVRYISTDVDENVLHGHWINYYPGNSKLAEELNKIDLIIDKIKKQLDLHESMKHKMLGDRV